MAKVIASMRDALRQTGYVASDMLAAQMALLAGSRPAPADDNEEEGPIAAMVLDGDPGTGKTFLAESMARVLHADSVYIAAHSGTTPEDLMYQPNIVRILRGVAGDREAVRSERDVVRYGFIPSVFAISRERPVVAFIDELDKARSETVDDCLLTAFQKGVVQVDGIGTVRAKRSNLLLFLTKNNKRQVSEALMRRCRRWYCDFPSVELERTVLTGAVRKGRLAKPLVVPAEPVFELPEAVANVLIGIASSMRARGEEVIKKPTTQELFMAGADVMRLARWGALEHAGEVAFGWLAAFPEDREVLESIVTPEKLGQLLAAAAKVAVGGRTSQAIGEVDDSFATFGG